MLDRLKAMVLDLDRRMSRQPTYGYATVTSVTPLRIRYDGQTDFIAGSPDTLVAGLSVGDRVWCQRIHRRDIILGKGNGTSSAGPSQGTTFSLKNARISYGATLGVFDRFVMQGAAPLQAENNRWFTSRNTVGTVAGRETTVVTRLGASGSGGDVMTFLDAGHGDGVFAEKGPDGITYVWSTFTDWRYPETSPSRRYNIVRVPWSPGTYSFQDVEQFRVRSVSGVNWRASFDEYNGILAFRSGAGGTRRMSAYRLSDVLSSAGLPPAVASAEVPMSSEHGSVQDHAFMYEVGRWFFLYGGVTGPQAIISYRPNGTVDFVKRIDDTSNIDAWGTPFNQNEPEGLTVHHDSSGNPSLIFGVSTGPVYARKNHLYSVDMGVKSPAFDLLASTLPADTSPWVRSRVSEVATLEPGFSEVLDRPFALRIAGGKVEFRGRFTGSISPAQGSSVRIMRLHETFWPDTTRQTECIIPGDGRVCRLEISPTGLVVLYLPSGSTGTLSWVDFDISNYWLKDVAF